MSDIQGQQFVAESDMRLSALSKQELDAIMHQLGQFGVQNKSCIDVGFMNPQMSLALRELGGYWYAVPRAEADCECFANTLGEEISPVGPQNELPFEDKQFDIAVVASGMFTGEWEHDVATLREVHRVLRPTGFIVASVPCRKPLGLANLFMKDRSGYVDKQLFDLFKHGFDVLGSRSYCKFWTHLSESSGSAARKKVAATLDCFVIAKGYKAVVCGRRKVWRERTTPVVRDGRSLGNAVLFPYG